MIVQMLMTGPDGKQRSVGELSIVRGKVVAKPVGTEGIVLLRDILKEAIPAFPSTRTLRAPITAMEPELFLRALPFQYDGSRLRAKLSE